MAIVNDIIAAHSGGEPVEAGQLVTVNVDKVYVQDGNSPTIAKIFGDNGCNSVFDKDAVGIFFDHSVITPNIAIANRLKEAHAFATQLGVQVFPQGAGISHVVALENGWFGPGEIVMGSDSHTCTGGAVQSLALGMGASDIAAAMMTGEAWLKVPDTVWLNIKGRPLSVTKAKDVVLHVLATLGQEDFLYRSVEWMGPWVSELSLDSAATVASLGVELGAKCVFLPDGAGRPDGMRQIKPDAGGRILEVDITDLPPMIAKPHSPSNVVSIDEMYHTEIDYVFVGSCTNSRLEDIADVAHFLTGRKVSDRVHCLVTPGSKAVYLEAVEKGYISALTEAGAVVTPPGCGSCLGTQGSIPADGDRVLSTMNRNFLGRMGNPKAEIYLSSPLVAAHAAVHGRIPSVEDLL
ncbi:aconitase/3-isopropylmalate dehydratase large subunit family protein [uncultured Ruegeria sp.]|uniref:3-isopropylmalate dehydratase large subunit n=1 Tax=uncultured Ruegeria sp. TaxID=259304 RepID=UPI00262AAC6C|nr:aconitase/3-isopropylmalate dehydratase large subunit family protein [uncultured Ruegeria sp.]